MAKQEFSAEDFEVAADLLKAEAEQPHPSVEELEWMLLCLAVGVPSEATL